ncbi:MAG: hypothetical protein Q7U71_02525, partial [bacterium]|nr:hypothetical protein [bacterium]
MNKILNPLVAVVIFSVCVCCNNKSQVNKQTVGTLNTVDTSNFIKHLTVENDAGGFIDGGVTSITENKRGEIAIGRENGVMVYNDNKWKIYRLPKTWPHVFYDGDDKLWFYTKKQLFKLIGDKFETVQTPLKINSEFGGVAVDYKKNIWFITNDDGIFIWDGKRFEQKLLIDTISVQLCKDIASLSDSTILIATEDDILWCKDDTVFWDGIPPQFYPVQGASIEKVSKDMLMVNVGEDGPDEYIYYQKKWTQVSDDAEGQISTSANLLNLSLSDKILQGFISNSASTLFYIDSKHNIWEAKNPPGLFYRWCFGSEKVEPVRPDVGLPTNVINDLCFLGNKAYVATPYGLFKTSAGEYKPIYTEAGVSDVKSYSSQVWALSGNNLLCINDSNINIHAI